MRPHTSNRIEVDFDGISMIAKYHHFRAAILRFFMISAKPWAARQICNLSVDTLIEQFLDWIPQNTRKLKITALEFFG